MIKIKEKTWFDTARERFLHASQYYEASRLLSRADTQFVMGDSDNLWQWPEDVSNQRQQDRKVKLTVNLTAQHCNQIVNNIRENKPQVKVLPVDDKSDKNTADILTGVIRNIYVTSNAEFAHDTAMEHAVYGGEGYWRIVTEYSNEKEFDHVIKIKPCNNPDLVFIDPDSKEADRSDARWGFIFEDISREQFNTEYPDLEEVSLDWKADTSGWVNKETIRRAEYFWRDDQEDKLLLLDNGTTILLSDVLSKHGSYVKGGGSINAKVEFINGESRRVVRERNTHKVVWKWCHIVGHYQDPIYECVWPGSYLPIICVVGKEICVNGEIVRKGMVRDLKDSARMVNYAFSECIQSIALQNNIPYVAAVEAIGDFKQMWERANVENRGVLVYKSQDVNGNPLLPPQRQPSPNIPAAQIHMLEIATQQMRGASGQQNANFGIKSEAQSGIGIQRLKVQGELATFHFIDNFSRALRYEGKVLVDLISKLYTTSRVMRIMGADNNPELVYLNSDSAASFYKKQEKEIGAIQKIFNPGVGTYDVSVSIGPSFQSQRQEAFSAMMEIASRNPKLMEVAPDLMMKLADVPGVEEFVKRLEKTLPPGLLNNEEENSVSRQQYEGTLKQAQAGMLEMKNRIASLEEELKTKQAETQSKLQVAELAQSVKMQEVENKFRIEQFRAETERNKLELKEIDSV